MWSYNFRLKDPVYSDVNYAGLGLSVPILPHVLDGLVLRTWRWGWASDSGPNWIGALGGSQREQKEERGLVGLVGSE
jgi:hypothetical protein